KMEAFPEALYYRRRGIGRITERPGNDGVAKAESGLRRGEEAGLSERRLAGSGPAGPRARPEPAALPVPGRDLRRHRRLPRSRAPRQAVRRDARAPPDPEIRR